MLAASCTGETPPPRTANVPAQAASTVTEPVLPPLAPYQEPPSCAGLAPENGPAPAARQVLQGRHVQRIGAMSFSTRGLLASASEDGSVRIWDVANRSLIRVLRSSDVGQPRRLAWNDAGDRLSVWGEKITTVTFELDGRAVGSRNGGFDLWVRDQGSLSLRKGTEDYTKKVLWFEDAPGHRVELRHATLVPDEISLSADGSTVVAPSGRGVSVWRIDPTAPANEQRIEATGRVLSAAVDAAGEHVLAVVEGPHFGRETTIVLSSVKGGEPPRTLEGARSFAREVVASPDGKRAAAVAYDGVWVYDLPSGAVRWSSASRKLVGHAWSTDGNYEHAVFSRDGRWLVVAQLDGTLAVLDATTGRAHGELGSRVRSPRAIAFAPGGDRILAATNDRLTLWSTASGEVVEHLETRDVLAVSMTAQGDVEVTQNPQYGGCVGGSTYRIERWKGTTAPDPYAPALRSLCVEGLVQSVSLPLNKAIVSLPNKAPKAVKPGAPPAPDHLTHVVELGDKNKKPVLLDKYDESYAIAPTFTPDGRHVLAATGSGYGLDNSLGVWDARTGKLLRQPSVEQTLQGTSGSITSSVTLHGVHHVALTPDGKHIAMVYGKRVSVRDFAKDKEIATFDAAAMVTAATFLGDAHTLAVGLEDGGFAIYRDGTARASGTSPGGPIRGFVRDAGSGALLSLSDDGALRLWDTARGSLRATLVDFDDDEYLAFTPGGAYAGSGEVSDRVAWAFDAPPEVFRFEQFERDYRKRPIVLARLAGRDDDVPPVTRRPPRVAFEGAPAVGPGRAKVRVHAASGSRVDAVRVYVEGRPAAARAICAKEGDAEVDVSLESGTNRVTVTAFDDHAAASNPAVADVTSATTTRPDVWVVAAGVSRYPNLPDRYQLQLAAADARGTADAFAAQAGPGKTYAAAHVTALLDDEVTVASLTRALDDLSRMKPSDVAIVALAGHGVKPSPDEDMVFLTSTADATPAGARASGVGWTQIGKRLAAARGRVLVLLDACHSGHVTQDVVVPNGDLATSLVREQRAGVLVFAAAKGRQLSYEPTGTRGLDLVPDARPLVTTASAHGFFTAAVLASLAAPETDRDDDGAIEVSELVDAVSARVARATNGLQTPWVARRELFGDFHLVELAPRPAP